MVTVGLGKFRGHIIEEFLSIDGVVVVLVDEGQPMFAGRFDLGRVLV
jgi:hypothetical protein